MSSWTSAGNSWRGIPCGTPAHVSLDSCSTVRSQGFGSTSQEIHWTCLGPKQTNLHFNANSTKKRIVLFSQHPPSLPHRAIRRKGKCSEAGRWHTQVTQAWLCSPEPYCTLQYHMPQMERIQRNPVMFNRLCILHLPKQAWNLLSVTEMVRGKSVRQRLRHSYQLWSVAASAHQTTAAFTLQQISIFINTILYKQRPN